MSSARTVPSAFRVDSSIQLMRIAQCRIPEEDLPRVQGSLECGVDFVLRSSCLHKTFADSAFDWAILCRLITRIANRILSSISSHFLVAVSSSIHDGSGFVTTVVTGPLWLFYFIYGSSTDFHCACPSR